MGVIFALTFFSLTLMPDIVTAQPPPPTSERPGSQAARFENEEIARKGALERKKPKAPQIDIEPEKAPEPEAAGPAGGASPARALRG